MTSDKPVSYFYDHDWPWITGMNGRYYRADDVDALLAKSGQCDVTDLEGNHCPELPIHWVVVNRKTVHLCEKCYTNVLDGAYKKGETCI